jgi:hypothetical protein
MERTALLSDEDGAHEEHNKTYCIYVCAVVVTVGYEEYFNKLL